MAKVRKEELVQISKRRIEKIFVDYVTWLNLRMNSTMFGQRLNLSFELHAQDRSS